jgi:hypothetical protein
VEPFRVICETCRSRLKVSSAEAIGQIHACPKCGSMVQIVPPADWKSGPATAAAAAATPQQPVFTLSTTSSTVLPADFGIDLSVAPSRSVPAAEVAVASAVPAPKLAASGWSPVVWCGIGSAAAFAIAGLTYVLWPSGDKPTTSPLVVAQNTSTVPPVAQTARQDLQSAETTTNRPTVNGADPYSVDHSQNAPVATMAAKPVEPEPTSTASAVAPRDDLPPVPAPPTPAPVAPEPTEETANAIPPAKLDSALAPTAPATAASNATEPAHVLKFDPLDFDPEHMSLSPTPAVNAPMAGSIPPEAATQPPAAGVAENDKAPAPADILAPPVEHKTINVRRGPIVDDSPPSLEAAARLAAKLPSLQVSDVPLSRFVDTLSQLAGVPITLDPIALEWNGMSPRTLASATATNESIDKVLGDALAAQRLELADDHGKLAVVLAGRDERKAVDFDVKDLATGADAASIARLVEQFVAPTSWKSAGGTGTIEVTDATLQIDQSLAVRREGLIFCERLRRARGLALRSKYPAELLTVDSPYEKLAPKLNQRTTFTFMAWTPLADIVQEWQALLGVTILVDWSALREAEVSPTSQLACSTIDRPWAEALDGILGPLGLTWWAVDGQTIQITTIDALERIDRVEFYLVPKKLLNRHADSQLLIAALQMEIVESPNNSGKSGSLRMELDEPSGRLIVRATPDVHQFLTGRFAAVK